MRNTETAVAARAVPAQRRVLVLVFGRARAEPGASATELYRAGFDVVVTSEATALEEALADAPAAILLETDRVSSPVLEACR